MFSFVLICALLYCALNILVAAAPAFDVEKLQRRDQPATYNFDIGWINANPDGKFRRPIIAINGQWPPPTINVRKGQQLIVNVKNNLGNQTTSVHWHGNFQKGSNSQDGTPMVAQCPIGPGQSYTYSFTVDQPGTYWYHSHSPAQYADGLRGPLIVHDDDFPYNKNNKDQLQEIVLTLSDWYHEQAANLENTYVVVDKNPTDGSEPVPPSALMNDQTNPKIKVEKSKKYYLRIINMSGFAQFYLHIPGHSFSIIEVDGVYTHPYPAQDLYIANGQRYGVILQTKDTDTQNYPILGAMDPDAFDPAAIPDNETYNVTGVLVYDDKKSTNLSTPLVDDFNVIDDINLTPLDDMPLLQRPDIQSVQALSFFTQESKEDSSLDQFRAGFNNITYIAQKVPTLYTALSAPDKLGLNQSIYGTHTNSLVVRKNQVVEIVINNYDGGPHPMHIHGHNVQIVARGPGVYDNSLGHHEAHGHKHKWLKEGILNGNKDASALGYKNSTRDMRSIPMRRDTWTIPANSYSVIRFVADNPGTWLMHCHMEWHMSAGLLLTLVEAPEELKATQSQIPKQMQQICAAQNIPLAGNAAGNVKTFLDLSGQVTVAPYPNGANV